MTTAVHKIKIGRSHHGRKMPFDRFIGADFQDGWLYELARGVIVVTDIPGINHGRIVERLPAPEDDPPALTFAPWPRRWPMQHWMRAVWSEYTHQAATSLYNSRRIVASAIFAK